MEERISRSSKLKFLVKNIAIYGLVFLVLGMVFGYWLGYARTIKYTQSVVNSIHSVRENNQSYHFIYPLLLYSFGDAKKFLTDQPLETKIKNYIQNQLQNKNADDVSVVIRGFPDGGLVNINQDDQYHPGSLLKVLIMMAYFREAEPDPTVLQKNLMYNKITDQEITSQQYSMIPNLKIGQSYNTEQLIEDMIGNSDNGAEQLLLDNVDRKILDQAYIDLGVSSPDLVAGPYTISVGQYAGFLRILYNSTYLSEQYSEQSLSIMSKSSYKDGIVAGMPAGTLVAHKYGERVDNLENNIQVVELHDCGIVYAKQATYELCVMTKGTDIGKLTAIIKDISNITYNHEISLKDNK